MIQPKDADWLALCLVTESSRPEEWPHVAQAIENRLRSRRWGDSYEAVILAPKQFSAFNDARGESPRALFTKIGRSEDLLALLAARFFVGEGGRGDTIWSSEITPETFHYYSPISMRPPGSWPPWAGRAKRLYSPPGIDPARFVFAEGVP